MLYRLTVAVALAFTLTHSAAAQAPERIRVLPQFAAGEKTQYEHRLRTAQGQAMQTGLAAEVRLDATRTFTLRTIEIDDEGAATVELTFDRIALSLQAPARAPVDFDSDRPQSQDGPGRVSKALRRIAATPIRYTVSADGRVLDVEGPETISQFVGDRRDVVFLQSVFGQRWFELIGEQIWSIGPGVVDTMRVGEEWTEESTSAVGGLESVDSSVTFTLTSTDEQTATFVGEGEFSLKHLEPDPALGEEATAEVADQRMDFEIIWSHAEGRVNSHYTIQELAIEVRSDRLGKIGEVSFFTEASMEAQ